MNSYIRLFVTFALACFVLSPAHAAHIYEPGVAAYEIFDIQMQFSPVKTIKFTVRYTDNWANYEYAQKDLSAYGLTIGEFYNILKDNDSDIVLSNSNSKTSKTPVILWIRAK